MYDDYIYSSDPMIEELTIERNGDDDYWREIAEAEALGEAEALMDEWRDEEMADAQDDYDAAVFDLSEDIPF